MDTGRLEYMSVEGSHAMILVFTWTLVIDLHIMPKMVISGSMRLTRANHYDSRFRDTGGYPEAHDRPYA